MHKISPDIHLMCELHVTVKLFTRACSLSDADSHFFPNNMSCSLLNISFIHRKQISNNFRISNGNEIADLSGIGLNLILNNICASAWKLGIQKAKNNFETDGQVSVCL